MFLLKCDRCRGYHNNCLPCPSTSSHIISFVSDYSTCKPVRAADDSIRLANLRSWFCMLSSATRDATCFVRCRLDLYRPPQNTTALFMGRSWLPFGEGAAKRQVCAVVAASPPVSYRHAVEGKGSDDDVEWRSYRRYWEGDIETSPRKMKISGSSRSSIRSSACQRARQCFTSLTDTIVKVYESPAPKVEKTVARIYLV